ncbi:hypothetical protein QA802_36945 [Streptomyces sp. B21-105]|uniref:hypothetical protein n=1 Tax=Streptomyces sp. B21-105 TaxID=3039417 RepID=UPI002FF3449E
MARALLSRYVDPDGYVAASAVDGVARLAGLDTREAAVLRAGARVRSETVVTSRSATMTEAEAAVGLPGAAEHVPEDVSPQDVRDLATPPTPFSRIALCPVSLLST